MKLKKMALCKPFVKWAGGKRQLVDHLTKHIPLEFNTYYEPFLGGGALFFWLYNRGIIKKAVLGDINDDLINAYRVIKNKVSDLILELSSSKYKNEKEVFYKIRESEPDDPVLRCARFIYLNRTCYNGLYRVNSKGKFNVPFGRYKNPKILDEENLVAVSESLQDTSILNEDFEKTLSGASKGDFVYFDPPYHPLNETSRFTSYTKYDFKEKDQERLAHVFKKLDKKGCYCLLSNSDTDFIRDLYSEFNISVVNAKRSINSNAEKRCNATELIIKNY